MAEYELQNVEQDQGRAYRIGDPEWPKGLKEFARDSYRSEWHRQAMLPSRFGGKSFSMQINFDPSPVDSKAVMILEDGRSFAGFTLANVQNDLTEAILYKSEWHRQAKLNTQVFKHIFTLERYVADGT